MTAQEAKEKTQESLIALNEKKKVFFANQLEKIKSEIDKSIMHAISLGKYELKENFIIEFYRLDNSEISEFTISECENFAAGIAKYLKENGYTFELKIGLINSINVFINWSK
jgi:hypothetical protein